mgnify:FL=1
MQTVKLTARWVQLAPDMWGLSANGKLLGYAHIHDGWYSAEVIGYGLKDRPTTLLDAMSAVVAALGGEAGE